MHLARMRLHAGSVLTATEMGASHQLCTSGWRFQQHAIPCSICEGSAGAHHLIPTEISVQFNDFLEKIGFKHNHCSNGCWLPKKDLEAFYKEVRHAGNHPGYSQAMAQKLTEISEKYDRAITIAAGNPRLVLIARKNAMRDIRELQDRARTLLTRDGEKIVLIGTKLTTPKMKTKWVDLLSVGNDNVAIPRK